MARIIAYQQAAPDSEDLLLGTQKTTGSANQTNPTKNFKVSDVVSAGLGYTNYVALIKQDGVDDPAATVIKNSTGETLTWARTGVGTYTVTALNGIFTADKTIVFVNQGGANNNGLVTWTRINTVSIAVQTFEISPAIVLADSILGAGGKGAFEVRIYT